MFIIFCGDNFIIQRGCEFITDFDDNAFQMCEKLNSVLIGNGNIEIGDSAFSYCEELVEVTIGKGSLKVGDYAFYGCGDDLVITYDGNKYDNESIEDI